MRVRIQSKRGHRFEEKIKNFDYSQVDAHSGSILRYNDAESGIGYDLRDPESVAGSLKELLEDFFLRLTSCITTELHEAQTTKGGDDLYTFCPVRDTQAQPGDVAMGRH